MGLPRYVSAMYLARSRPSGRRQAAAYSPGSARTWLGIGREPIFSSMGELFEPRLDEILAFCAREPVERVFLEDVARRGLGRFVAVRGEDGLAGLCHLGANV